MTGPVKVGNVTVTTKGDRIDAECSVCGQGLDVGGRFGMVPGDMLILEWAKRHTHAPKAKKARR